MDLNINFQKNKKVVNKLNKEIDNKNGKYINNNVDKTSSYKKERKKTGCSCNKNIFI